MQAKNGMLLRVTNDDENLSSNSKVTLSTFLSHKPLHKKSKIKREKPMLRFELESPGAYIGMHIYILLHQCSMPWTTPSQNNVEGTSWTTLCSAILPLGQNELPMNPEHSFEHLAQNSRFSASEQSPRSASVTLHLMHGMKYRWQQLLPV